VKQQKTYNLYQMSNITTPQINLSYIACFNLNINFNFIHIVL